MSTNQEQLQAFFALHKAQLQEIAGPDYRVNIDIRSGWYDDNLRFCASLVSCDESKPCIVSQDHPDIVSALNGIKSRLADSRKEAA